MYPQQSSSKLRPNSKTSNDGAVKMKTRTPPHRDSNLFPSLAALLRKQSLLPAILFVFSRRRCEEALFSLSCADLLSDGEKKHVRTFIRHKILPRLSIDDQGLPQVVHILKALETGVNTHHSGLLPILKEAIEMLFSDGCIKILIATETFAMGVNMPAKAVVFTEKRKPEGNGKFRDLHPGEYTQMAGRAGRRGLDPTGTVLLVPPEPCPTEDQLKELILGNPMKLSSQFRLTYNTILHILRIRSNIQIHDLMRKSFFENEAQKSLPTYEASLQKVKYTSKMRKNHFFVGRVCLWGKKEQTGLRVVFI